MKKWYVYNNKIKSCVVKYHYPGDWGNERWLLMDGTIYHGNLYNSKEEAYQGELDMYMNNIDDILVVLEMAETDLADVNTQLNEFIENNK